MVKKEVKTKSFEISPIVDVTEDLDLINQHTLKPLNAEEVYAFKVVLCDNQVDRAHDKMSDDFLVSVIEACNGLTGVQNHNWDSKDQVARLYGAEIVDEISDDGGDAKRYVLAKAYTLTSFTELIDKINAGLVKETSISFKSSGDTCSICGAETEGGWDVAVCPNGHVMGKEYDGKIAYNSINKLKDLYEWSLVAVPCQVNSGIKTKNMVDGGKGIMKKSMFALQKLINSKAYKEADDDTQKALKEAVEDEDDAELSEDDIKNLIADNVKLRDEVVSLKAKLEEAESGRAADKVATIVEKAVDALKPITPTVKENIMRDIDITELEVKDGNIEGIDVVMEGIRERYKGLIEDIDVDEDDEDGDYEEELEEVEEIKKKSMRNHNSGITFGVGSGTKEKSTKAVKSGISFSFK